MKLLIKFAQLTGGSIELLKSSMNIGKLRSELHGNMKTLGALALNHEFVYSSEVHLSISSEFSMSLRKSCGALNCN